MIPIETKSTGIKILGSGTCVPSLKRSACSVLVQTGAYNLLLDVGPGTMRQMLRADIQIQDIDVILLSHFHLDHSSELAAFIFASRYGSPQPRQKGLNIAGGNGLTDLYDALNRAYNNLLTLPGDILKIHELALPFTKSLKLNKINIRHAGVKHNRESLAYRITSEDGFSLAYSGDTDISDSLVDIAKGVDVFICESAFPDGHKVKGHLTPSLAGEIASRAGVGCLVLTHFYPECDKIDIADQCRKTYKGPLVIAEDMLEITRRRDKNPG